MERPDIEGIVKRHGWAVDRYATVETMRDSLADIPELLDYVHALEKVIALALPVIIRAHMDGRLDIPTEMQNVLNRATAAAAGG